MKLAYSPTSPYVRKVMVLLQETGQQDDVTLERITTTPLAPDAALLPQNPLGKVPALTLADGQTLFDSRVICAYLDARAGAGLYGDADTQWTIRTLEALGDGMLDAALLMAYEWRMRPEDKRLPEWVEGQWAKVARALDVLENQWAEHLQGPLDAGQIAVACALGYVDFRHDARNWRADRPRLAAWFKAFDSRPSMAGTGPE